MSEVIELSSEETKKQKKDVVVSFNDSGLVDFKNQKDLASAASLLIQMNMAPDSLKKNGIQAVMAALTFCKQYNLPYSALNELGYVKGKLGAFGSLMTALAKRSPEWQDFVVIYTNEKFEKISLENKNLDNEVFACVVRVRKKNSDVWNEYFFTKKEAEKAGLLSSNTYQNYLKTMLYHRAKAQALRTEFSDYLNGVESFELLQQEAEIKDVSPLNKLNERLGLIENKNEE